MTFRFLRRHCPHAVVSALACVSVLLATPTILAAQLDIHGPLGSVAFGSAIALLPNGNIVVTDPDGPVSHIGAVYVYDPNGNLISTLTGSTTFDRVGSGGIRIVGSGNAIVLSPSWNNTAGAVTWINGANGLNGIVSSANSLTGTTTGDQIGSSVSILTNGNYVVSSASWNNGIASSKFGAATWGSGASGISGTVSIGNSLIGTTAGDQVGDGVVALSNGNYVVTSRYWNNGVANSNVGAATWGNGTNGLSGAVSTSNSLFGITAGDKVGYFGATALSNGNYVVASPYWNNGVANSHVGAATWRPGAGASTAAGTAVSAGNSLIGTTTDDQVSSAGVAALTTNGNYVVASYTWNNGTPSSNVGAATWGNGAGGTVGAVSASNSLFGTTPGDQVGSGGATPLSNGNYVMHSYNWNNGVPNSNVGAVTWRNGGSATPGAAVSASNSLIGTTAGDQVGNDLVALSNGNYVVSSPFWNNGTPNSQFGAATWGNGAGGTTGSVSAANSVIGTTAHDEVGFTIAPLSNGNYVVASSNWNNGNPGSGVGAVTWCNGTSSTSAVVAASNSLIGTTQSDAVGLNVQPLSNGNYIVGSPTWNNATPGGLFGAATWVNGAARVTGVVSAGNSLIGTSPGDQIGY